MSMQPDTDRKLERTSRRLTANGLRLLAVAGVLAVVGIVLIITGASKVAGLFCVGLSLAPGIGALMLTGSGAVSQHASKRRPFA